MAERSRPKGDMSAHRASRIRGEVRSHGNPEVGKVRHPLRIWRLVTTLVTCAILGGCPAFNDVSRVSAPGHAVSPGRGLLLVGVGKEGEWQAPRFPVRLQQYDMSRHTVTGNCLRWNRVEAATDRKIEYFLFEVAPGFYAGGGGGAVFRDRDTPVAFEVPAGQVIYVGDFVYADDRKVDLRVDLERARGILRREYPNIPGDPVVARPLPVPVLPLLVCAP